MKYLDEDVIRDVVADFILTSAQDSDCLHEVVGDLLGDLALPDEEWDAEVGKACDVAYKMFGRATVSVVIDELEYND